MSGLRVGISRSTTYVLIIGCVVFGSSMSIQLIDPLTQGVYVLQDNQFKPLSRISSYDGQADALRRAPTVRNHIHSPSYHVVKH